MEIEKLDLPAAVKRGLGDFLAAAQAALGRSLEAVVLFGSAAEGRLRATSDVNVVLVLSAFEKSEVDRLREPLRIAEAAIRLRPMFLLRGEIEAAAQAFAVKFADLRRRRAVLYGADPFAGLEIPRPALVGELRQQVLNLTLRMRASYAQRSLREEQLAVAIAEAAGPLRSCAALLLELEGALVGSPKQALEKVAAAGQPGWEEAMARLSEARETRVLPPGAGEMVLFRLLDLAAAIRARAQALS